MHPVTVLDRIVHCLDRALDNGHRVNAFRRARAVVADLSEDELRARVADETLVDLPGIGATTAKVIEEALAGGTPAYLTDLEATTAVTITPEGAVIRDLLRGDCHSHSTWSDGGASILAMAETARGLGHDYLVLTDHSARLTIAHGLDRKRLEEQLVEVAAVNEQLAPFRLLTGMEVDILEDGGLDLDDDLLGRLDVVVASVHSKLKMEPVLMTQRMVRAAASPHVDILGHCTGRLIGKRAQSRFDADYVFAACARFGTAVEINCRPERLDPPDDLLELAIDHGCLFSIDTDAHATGQLEWQPHGCDKAAAAGLSPDRVVNTRTVDDLFAWTTSEKTTF